MNSARSKRAKRRAFEIAAWVSTFAFFLAGAPQCATAQSGGRAHSHQFSVRIPQKAQIGHSANVRVASSKKPAYFGLYRRVTGQWELVAHVQQHHAGKSFLQWKAPRTSGSVSLLVRALREKQTVWRSTVVKLGVFAPHPRGPAAKDREYVGSKQNPASPSHDFGTRLNSGAELDAGDYLTSADGHYTLVMQPDGNLVEYVARRPLWASDTAGNPGAYLAAQSTDGNIVLYAKDGHPLWATNTAGHPGSFLGIQPDANVVAYDSDGNQALWANAARDSSLQSGEELTAGQYLLSPDGHFNLTMQDDGNFVEYVDGRALWASGTSGSNNYAVQQADGNLVVYDSQSHPLWASHTDGYATSSTDLQNDANLVTYSPANGPVWADGATDSQLTAGEQLQPGQYLDSPNRQYVFVMQFDGNLVLYRGQTALWASDTAGNPGSFAGMQSTDGNFVVYSPSVAPLWASNTSGNPGDSLAMQSDGNAVIYGSNGAIWASNTAAGSSSPSANQGQEIVNFAQAMQAKGYPYCWDGGTPSGPSPGFTDPYSDGSWSNCGSVGKVGFDCTGLTLYAVAQATGNTALIHGPSQPESPGGNVVSSESALQPGDIVYFDYDAANGLNHIDHAGVFVGTSNGQPMVLSAASEHYGIVTEPISWYAAGGLHFVGAVRFWR